MTKITNNDQHTRQLLTQHYKNYPNLQTEDVFKFLFQSAFGCEHLVASYERALGYIQREQESRDKNQAPLVESLDGNYSRAHLSCLDDGLSAQTLTKLFCLSAQKETDGLDMLKQKLLVATRLVDDGTLPLDKLEFSQKLDAWRNMGYPAIHHSDIFRSTYKPAYRVIANKYAKFLPVFTQIDKLLAKDNVVVAIEGGSASGKSTLAHLLSQVYDCNIFHMDDFFLRAEQRTAERLAEVGGNVDYERFAEEILTSLVSNQTVTYRPFDCSTQTLGQPVTVHPKQLTVVEGVYSMHPTFPIYHNLAVFLDVLPDVQTNRIATRNSPKLAQRFFDEWIPLENKYFANTNAKGRCNIIIKVEQVNL